MTPTQQGWLAAALGVTAVAGIWSYAYGRKKGHRAATVRGEKDDSPMGLIETTGKAFEEEAIYRFGVEGLAAPLVGAPAAMVLGNTLFAADHSGSLSRKAEVALHGLLYSGVFAVGTMAGGPLAGLAASTVVHTAHNAGVGEGFQDAACERSRGRAKGCPKP
jgi:hypothetical protein